MNPERIHRATCALHQLEGFLRDDPRLSKVARRIRALTLEIEAAIDEMPNKPSACEWCERPIIQKRMGRPRRFCSRPCQRCSEYARHTSDHAA